MKFPWSNPALRQAFLFWLFLALCIGATHAFLMRGLQNRRVGDFGVWNRLVRGEINADILVTGSSRALTGVDASQLGTATGRSAFNMAVDGSNPNLQLPWLETYFAHNRHPQVVVQVLDLTSLTIRSDPYHPWQYVPYLGEPALYANLVRLAPEFRLHKYIPLFSFAKFPGLTVQSLKTWLRLDDPAADERRLGFKRVDENWRHEFARYQRLHPAGVTMPVQPEAIAVLRQIIETVQAHGSQIVLVFAPEYIESQRMTLNRAELFRIYQELAATYQIPFWDFSGIPLVNDTRYFYNSQHVNGAGADVFSGLLGQRLAEWLAGQADP